MPPRRRLTNPAAAAAGVLAGGGVLNFQQLPDAALVCILAGVPAKARHRLALVNRRWHACAHAPELCRQVDLCTLTLGLTATALVSLSAWLRRHGQHVRGLWVRGLGGSTLTAEVQAQLACCLMTCAGGQLQSLQLIAEPLVVAAWAPALGSLRQLHLGSPREKLVVSSSLGSLTQRTLLILDGSPIQFGVGTHLPGSIEQLRFSDTQDVLPEQLLGLSRLSALILNSCRHTGDGFAGLTRLSALRRLQLQECPHLPACLGQLTWLEALTIQRLLPVTEDQQQARELLNSALGQLTQLSSLLLHNTPARGGLPALAGLSRLQRACFRWCDGLGSLPAGPWSGSLRELGADWDCLQRSRQFLVAAMQLQKVVVHGGGSRAALLRWAATHPPLRQLQLNVCSKVPAELLNAVLRLKQERPQLQLTHEMESAAMLAFEDSFEVQMLLKKLR